MNDKDRPKHRDQRPREFPNEDQIRGGKFNKRPRIEEETKDEREATSVNLKEEEWHVVKETKTEDPWQTNLKSESN